MKDEDKSRKELIDELKKLRNELARQNHDSNLDIKSHEMVLELPEINKTLIQYNNSVHKNLELQAKSLNWYKVFNLVPNIAFIITDLDGQNAHILEFSPGAENIFGYTRKEIIGKPVALLYPPEDRAMLDEKITLLEMQKEGLIEERTLMKKSGEKFSALFSCYPIMNKTGKLVHTMSVTVDISTQKEFKKRLALSEARYRAVVEDQTELICRFLPDSTLTFVNEAYSRYFGKSYNQLIGTSFLLLIPEENRRNIFEYIYSLTQANPVSTYEHRVIQANGEIAWQEWTDRAIFDSKGNLLEIQSVGRDISERKRAEEELRKAREELEDRVQERTEELSRAYKEVTRLSNNFTYIFNNSPIGVIMINNTGQLEQLNPTAEQMLGKLSEEIKGKHITYVTQGKAPYTHEMLVNGETFSEVEVVLNLTSKVTSCLVSGIPIKNKHGDIEGGVIFFQPTEKIHSLINHISGSEASFTFKDIKTRNTKMFKILEIAAQAADSTAPILIEGESGTGKEMFAHSIHNQSSRCNGPFIAVNCSALPRELVISELFGYAEGAFTGARRGGKPGKFELASGGTLFLDEIGDMPLEQQATLLRVIEEKTITRVGGSRPIPVDVRIICATNKDLRQEVENKNFRRDLYYRLNVIYIVIPPLRERREDIPYLARYFLEELSKRYGKENINLDHNMVRYLMNYDWPGNVRELENTLEKMFNMSEDCNLSTDNIPSDIYHCATPETLAFSVSTSSIPKQRSKKLLVEKQYYEIVELLDRFGGNISKVSEELGINRSTVYRRIKRYNTDK